MKKIRMVLANLKKNSYKQWTCELSDDGNVTSEFGAVGAKVQVKNYGRMGESFYNKKINEKLKKGYTEARVLLEDVKSTEINKSSLADIALSQIKITNDNLIPLIKRLANSNVHKITNSTSISFDNGVFQTPLGIVTKDGVQEARVLLDFFFKNIKNNGTDSFNEKIDDYLRIIPRPKCGRLLYEEVFPDLESIKKEADVLDALDNSVDMAMKPTGATNSPIEKVFSLNMGIVEDQKAISAISDWYRKTNKSMHNYQHISIKNIYEVDLEEYNKNFLTNPKNVVEVFHGSGQANILSVLKSGLKTSPPNTAAIAGKAFGNGTYGSETASKSLGYSLGRWGQGSGDSGWLFICDFAMGNPYYATNTLKNIPAGYDSCWALPKNTRLLNDELIVYSEDRIRIKYLLELK